MSDGMTEAFKDIEREGLEKYLGELATSTPWTTGTAKGNYTPEECTLGNEGFDEEDLVKGNSYVGVRHIDNLVYSGTAIDDSPEVTRPTHYMLFNSLEVIEAIELLLSDEEYIGYCKGNILKYRLRAGKKDDALKDLGKAKQYEAMLKEVE